jgi:predicted MPP superfamily phosphohydrolase
MRYLKILILILLCSEIGYFIFTETTNIQVNRQEIRDKELAEVFGDVKIVHISDLHIGRRGFTENKLVNTIRDLDPQIILITGDLLSGNNGIQPCLNVVKDLAEGRLVLVTLGNGDHSFGNKHIDTERLVRGLENAGARVLENESLMIRIRGEGLPVAKTAYIVGLDDNYLFYDNIFKAMNNVPSASPKILLAHAPNIIDKIDVTGINLILSVHTHGGQIYLPFIGALYLNPVFGANRRIVAGLYHFETKIYVSKGIGTTSVPIRLFCRPEIAMLKFIK